MQGQELLRSVAGLCLVLFCGVLHREILMDLNDVDGDRDNGVHTVPLVFGKPAALAIAACLAAASVAAAAYMLATAPPPALLVSLWPLLLLHLSMLNHGHACCEHCRTRQLGHNATWNCKGSPLCCVTQVLA